MYKTLQEQSGPRNYPRFFVYWIRNFYEPHDGRYFCSFLHRIPVDEIGRIFSFQTLPMTLSNIAIFDTKCQARIVWQREGRRDELIINESWGFPSPKIYRIASNQYPLRIIEYLYRNPDINPDINVHYNKI